MGDDEFEAGRDFGVTDIPIAEGGDDADSVAAVQGAHENATGGGGIDGDARGEGIASFAEQQIIRIEAEHVFETFRKGEAAAFIDLDLGDAIEFIFDRVFDGEDGTIDELELVKECVEGGGFATAGGAGDEAEAGDGSEPTSNSLQGLGIEPELIDAMSNAGWVEDPQGGFFAELARDTSQTDVEMPIVQVIGEMGVMGMKVGDGIQAGDGFDVLQQALAEIGGEFS